MSALAIRPMNRADLDTAIDWAAAEGWNPGLTTPTAFFAADPEGFLMGFLGDEPVACISVVSYGDAYGFLGFYICRPDIAAAATAQRWAGGDRPARRTYDRPRRRRRPAGELRQVGVRARPSQHPLRRTWQGRARPADARHGRAARQPCRRRPARSSPMTRLFAGATREISARMGGARPGGERLPCARTRRSADTAAIRPCREGYKIGPLFADTPEIAERAVRRARPAPARRAGVPRRARAESRCGRAGRAPRHGAGVRDGAHVSRPAPDLPLDRIFGITTFELG